MLFSRRRFIESGALVMAQMGLVSCTGPIVEAFRGSKKTLLLGSLEKGPGVFAAGFYEIDTGLMEEVSVSGELHTLEMSPVDKNIAVGVSSTVYGKNALFLIDRKMKTSKMITGNKNIHIGGHGFFCPQGQHFYTAARRMDDTATNVIGQKTGILAKIDLESGKIVDEIPTGGVGTHEILCREKYYVVSHAGRPHQQTAPGEVGLEQRPCITLLNRQNFAVEKSFFATGLDSFHHIYQTRKGLIVASANQYSIKKNSAKKDFFPTAESRKGSIYLIDPVSGQTEKIKMSIQAQASADCFLHSTRDNKQSTIACVTATKRNTLIVIDLTKKEIISLVSINYPTGLSYSETSDEFIVTARDGFHFLKIDRNGVKKNKRWAFGSEAKKYKNLFTHSRLV